MKKSLHLALAGKTKYFALMAACAPLTQAAIAAEECPVWLALEVDAMAKEDAVEAQRYADCVSAPWLPTQATRSLKLTDCSAARPEGGNEKLQSALDWVDHIAAQFPGCETRLKIKRK